MLNASSLNSAPLNDPGGLSRFEYLAAGAVASATFDALGLRVQRKLAATMAASATFDALTMTRRRGMVVDAAATATIVGEMSVEIGGVVHAYLSASPVATATFDSLALRVVAPLVASMTTSATADTTLYKRVRAEATLEARADAVQPFLTALVDLGNLPPGQDSIVGSRNIRAFAFASVTMRKRKSLAANLAATATFASLRLQTRTNLAALLLASATTAVSLFRRYQLQVDAQASATIEALNLYTRDRLAADMTAVVTIEAPLYMNIFDVAPIERTVFVRFNPRVVTPNPPEREVDA